MRLREILFILFVYSHEHWKLKSCLSLQFETVSHCTWVACTVWHSPCQRCPLFSSRPWPNSSNNWPVRVSPLCVDRPLVPRLRQEEDMVGEQEKMLLCQMMFSSITLNRAHSPPPNSLAPLLPLARFMRLNRTSSNLSVIGGLWRNLNGSG